MRRITPNFLSSAGLEHLVYTEKVVGSNPTGSTMKKLLFVIPILLSSCVTRSDVINLGVTGALFTAVSTIDQWGPENIKEQIKEKEEKRKAEEKARREAEQNEEESN